MSPKPALTDEGMELYMFVSRASGIDHLAAQLSRLEPEERARFAAVMKKEGKALKALWEKKGHEGRALLLAAHLNPTPSQLVTAMTGWALDNLSHGGGAEHLRKVVRGRGQEWGTAFVQAALKKSSVVQAAPGLLNSLIDEFGLPLPETPAFWRAWVDHDPSPRPGIRWQERFIRACQTPGAFTDDWYDEPHPGAVAEALREIEDRDEEALVAALLSVIERDDSPACQRRALWWLDHLGLADRLWDHRQALIRCLVMAERSVAKHIVEVCLRFKLEDNELSAFTFVALGRPEKGLKRQVLKELIRRRVPAHSVDTWNVQARATDPDTTTAALARQLLEQWGVDVQNPRDQRALWQKPVGREDVPTDYDAVLDPSSLAELLSRVEQLDEDDDPELAERTLAALIAAAHDRGAVRIRHAIRTSLGTDLNRGPALRRLLASLARKGEEGGRVRTRKLTSQTFLVGQRISEALNALGEVPCLLSTPSHHDFRVSWEAFRDRARRYRETGAATLRIDVAVALARLDRDAVPELTEFAQPIAGLEVSLADVLTHWASHPASPGKLSFAPPRPGHEHRWYLGERVRADGDAPTSHELLGLRTGWTLPFAPTSKFDLWQDELSVFSLLPEHPTRPIALALRGLGEGITVNRLAQVATTAHRLGPNGAFGLLAAASDVPAKDRSGIAYPLQEAWHAGRITSDDLVTGWRHEDREVVGISPGKTIPMLVELAEGSCLALVWPLLVEIAETLAAERATATTAAALEAILQFLPEVPHPVELPNIAALAERKGSSKAIKTARLIVANMTPSPSGKAGR